MDVDRCVALHNEIVQLACEGSGHSVNDSRVRSWCEHYGAEADALRDTLSPEVVAFLERAWVIRDLTECSFFYYVNGLRHPSRLVDESINEIYADGEARYLVLYEANDISSHPCGLVFDQETSTATLCMTIWDHGTAFNGRQRWYPLERVLEAWLDVIRIGKVRAVADDVEGRLDWYKPWALMPCSDAMLEETIEAYEKLVKAIEVRIPGLQTNDRGTPEPLSASVLEAAPCSRVFADKFLRRVRQARFQHIAPGLSIPTPSTVSDQPFLPLVGTRDAETPPFLLFRSIHHYTAPLQHSNHGSELPFSWPYSQVPQYPAGLFLSDLSTFDDACTLVLPFGIGENGYARTSDGARFGENTEADEVEPSDTFADIYQQGHNPFVEGHGARLVTILQSWLGMVERGDWQIDENGVMGGVDEWKKADTQAHWERYVIPMTW